MRYALLIYENEQHWASLPKPEVDRVMGEYRDFTDSLRRSKNLAGGEELQPTSTATTIRIKDGRRLTTDGPFAETREQLGGFYLVDARNIDEAIAIASRIPAVRVGGCVEVRPCVEHPGQG